MIGFVAFIVIVGLSIWAINGLLNALRDFDD